MVEVALLHCPIRGPLSVSALAKDGLTATEEARRIDFIRFLIERGYPEENIAVETVVLKSIGESGRNRLRCDVIAYSTAAHRIAKTPIKERLLKALLVAEIKRDSKKVASAIDHQLEPALRMIPGMQVMGAYWDDTNRLLLTKQLIKGNIVVFEDTLSSLPVYGVPYKRKLLTYAELVPSQNLVGVLFDIANIMRSHGINDEQTRYKETVKLLLARYCDERAGASSSTKPVILQVYPGADDEFADRVFDLYQVASKRYSRAKGLFEGSKTTALPERTLRAIVKKIQGINFHAASNETMQQVFMSFVPAVFKKALDQYFTPIELVKCMVEMVAIGPNDKIVDPGMGTADFLTAAVQYRSMRGDDDIIQRIYGMDSDDKAYDLAIVNMILNKDGSSNLSCEDSILRHSHLAGEMGVALCNPPFGEKSVESRQSVLENYDLGHVWDCDENGRWTKSATVHSKQQLGLLFIERCYKLLDDGGRLGIILPEGYLSTATYGYVRQWLLDHFRIIGLIELPRRIFVKSNADLRSNVVIAQKLNKKQLRSAVNVNYPIYSNMVRKVGFKMGKGFSALYLKDRDTGIEIRNLENERITDSDFRVIVEEFEGFTRQTRWAENSGSLRVPDDWIGARVDDILQHPNLDLKPRRLMPAALQNIARIRNGDFVPLSDIAEVVSAKIDILEHGPSRLWRPVAGLDIHAVEGFVTPSHPRRAWQIAEEKKPQVFKLKTGDIVVGLVRPERRNIGLLIDEGSDIIGIPDGIAVVRVRKEAARDYPQGWLFSVLRSEACRLQFWTESGGTSYGKLSDDQIRNVLIPVSAEEHRLETGRQVQAWASALETSNQAWAGLGTDLDRRPILNSSGFGLMPTTDWDDVDDE